jgi:site-specific DNA recombinase
VSTAVLKLRRNACPVRRVPAGEVEAAVIGQVRRLLVTPEVIVRTWRAACEQDGTIGEGEVRSALSDLDPVWEELFPAEQARIVQILVERADVKADGLGIRLRTEGLRSLFRTSEPARRRGKRHEPERSWPVMGRA